MPNLLWLDVLDLQEYIQPVLLHPYMIMPVNPLQSESLEFR